MASEKPQLLELTPAPGAEGRRIDLFLSEQIPHLTRSQAQKLIQNGMVTVDGATPRAKDPVPAGALVRVQVPEAAPVAADLPTVALDIVFEDEEIVVVNKPAGLTVHPGAGVRETTLLDALKAHLGPKAFTGPEFRTLKRPGIVHRLDKDTSGLLVCAKTVPAHEHLSAQFQAKTNLREYVTLLDGYMEHHEIIHTSWLARDARSRTRFTSLSEADYAEVVAARGPEPEGFRWAKSTFTRRKTYGKRLTLAFVRLHTGRTHQIRLHARDLKMAVVGDMTYHRPLQLPTTFPDHVRAELKKVRQQLLHARILGFTHPATGRDIAFEAPLPEHFRKVLTLLEESGVPN